MYVVAVESTGACMYKRTLGHDIDDLSCRRFIQLVRTRTRIDTRRAYRLFVTRQCRHFSRLT